MGGCLSLSWWIKQLHLFLTIMETRSPEISVLEWSRSGEEPSSWL